MLHRAPSFRSTPVDAPGLLGGVDGRAGVSPMPPLFGASLPGASVSGASVAGAVAGAPVPLVDAVRPPSMSEAVPQAIREVVPAERSELLNRMLNVLVAGVALLILAPVCVLVAVLVKLTSPGPVFYTQTRVGIDRRWRRGEPGSIDASDTESVAGESVAGGPADEEEDDEDRRLEDLGGQPFTILKFRSMRVDAEAAGQAVWATKHDPRITAVGHILRKTRLDEIPQLINVLRGDMNVVGPRPERPSIVVRLREHVTEYPMRHLVKPGITGWAQINHSYDSCIEDVRTKVRYDLEYIAGQSLWLDVKIMCLTLPVMLFKRGAH